KFVLGGVADGRGLSLSLPCHPRPVGAVSPEGRSGGVLQRRAILHLHRARQRCDQERRRYLPRLRRAVLGAEASPTRESPSEGRPGGDSPDPTGTAVAAGSGDVRSEVAGAV